jgi:antitoxin YefM
MTILTLRQARVSFDRLIDETAASHRPILIVGKRGSAVLLSEEDWQATQETLFLSSTPLLRGSMRKDTSERPERSRTAIK